MALAVALAATFPVLPALAQTPYTIALGDTLWAIATRHGLTLAELVEANNLANPNLIIAGDTIIIPDRAGQPAPAATPAPPPAAAPTPAAQPAQPAPAQPQPRPANPGSVLDQRLIVTYYGNSYAGTMGILGQLSQQELVAALKRRAAEYEAASGRPTQAAIHFVATVAQASAGGDGMYRFRMPYDLIEEYSRLAADNDMLFFVDIQFGKSTVQAELAPWLPLLKESHVHLAMDPEFDMWGNERPGVDLGHMTAEEINYAQRVLSQLVADNGLPNKILMVYQFTPTMLPDKHNIVDDPRIDLVVNMDGFGGREIKTRHYGYYVADTPVEYGGIKLFLQHDTNLMTAADVMALEPAPDLVVYQ
jgi:LysM repeat protein